jgi:hypothetical protein
MDTDIERLESAVAEMNNLVELLSQLQEQTNPPERSKPAANSGGGGGQTTCTRCPKPKKPAARRRSGKTSIVRCRIKKGSRMARLFIFLIFDQKVYLQLSMTSTQSPPRPARPPPSPPSSIQPAGFSIARAPAAAIKFPHDGIREYGWCAPREHDQNRSKPHLSHQAC